MHSFSNKALILTKGRGNLLHFIIRLSGDLLFNHWTKRVMGLYLFDQRNSHSRTKGHCQDSMAQRQRIYRVLCEVPGLIKHWNLSESSMWWNNLFSVGWRSSLAFSKLQMLPQCRGPKSKNKRESKCYWSFTCPNEQCLKQHVGLSWC